MTEEIIRGDQETIRATITVTGGDNSLVDASHIEWYLTTIPMLGKGKDVLTKTLESGEIEVEDVETFKVVLTPGDTESLSTGDHYAECTMWWEDQDDPSTAELKPAVLVRDSKHHQA